MWKLFRKKEDKFIEVITEEVNKYTQELIRINNESTAKIIAKLDEIIKICAEVLEK